MKLLGLDAAEGSVKVESPPPNTHFKSLLDVNQNASLTKFVELT